MRGISRKKKSEPPCGGPEDQANFWVPSIPSVAWQPYPSPLERLRAHSFAPPPHDGFAIVEDGLKRLPDVLRGGAIASHPEQCNSRTRLSSVQPLSVDFSGYSIRPEKSGPTRRLKSRTSSRSLLTRKTDFRGFCPACGDRSADRFIGK